ncbi:MAG: sigma-54-dependent Fis family transcriptional regulator [Bryobacterales bacterium]|nr:sigma-54-dependent Fis family transcriptional regulator [Acidobacteriota bacterium]MCB9384806.1 sigma-54-dependent Fis family transcriptional regulator [Bryobacterales bacterium]
MEEASERRRARVLIVDDEADQRNGLASLVTSLGHEVKTAGDGREALDVLEEFRAHVMITDLNMPNMDGFELLRRLSLEGSAPTTIVLTAFGTVENAIKTVHDLGAFWFLEKPITRDALRTLLSRAVARGLLEEEREILRTELSSRGRLGAMVGQSAPMQEVFSVVRQVAPSKAAVLVTGESGVGKELVARAIHELSPRKDGPFVAINCAALPESLMESELFGHEKGAFTGALQRRQGCFELASGGTLLLDEIGDMPIGTQAKLLRVLEDSRVRRLGGDREIDVDVRLVAATNKQVENAVADGELREDLYYRLNVFHIQLPPLRERKDDILPIAEALIRSHNKKHDCKVVDIHPEVIEKFRRHSWPGNVRELRNVLERAVILAGQGSILPAHLVGFGNEANKPQAAATDPDAVVLPVGTTVREGEKALLLKTLEHTDNNKTRAAKILEISLKTLHNKLKEYGESS